MYTNDCPNKVVVILVENTLAGTFDVFEYSTFLNGNLMNVPPYQGNGEAYPYYDNGLLIYDAGMSYKYNYALIWSDGVYSLPTDAAIPDPSIYDEFIFETPNIVDGLNTFELSVSPTYYESVAVVVKVLLYEIVGGNLVFVETLANETYDELSSSLDITSISTNFNYNCPSQTSTTSTPPPSSTSTTSTPPPTTPPPSSTTTTTPPPPTPTPPPDESTTTCKPCLPPPDPTPPPPPPPTFEPPPPEPPGNYNTSPSPKSDPLTVSITTTPTPTTTTTTTTTTTVTTNTENPSKDCKTGCNVLGF